MYHHLSHHSNYFSFVHSLSGVYSVRMKSRQQTMMLSGSQMKPVGGIFNIVEWINLQREKSDKMQDKIKINLWRGILDLEQLMILTNRKKWFDRTNQVKSLFVRCVVSFVQPLGEVLRGLDKAACSIIKANIATNSLDQSHSIMKKCQSSSTLPGPEMTVLIKFLLLRPCN